MKTSAARRKLIAAVAEWSVNDEELGDQDALDENDRKESRIVNAAIAFVLSTRAGRAAVGEAQAAAKDRIAKVFNHPPVKGVGTPVVVGTVRSVHGVHGVRIRRK